MYRLIICEKPKQGASVARALGGGRPIPGGIDGGDWMVTWAFGHMLRLSWPEEYKEFMDRLPPGSKGGWVAEALPFFPKNFRYVRVDTPNYTRQLSTILRLLKGASEVLICTDPDREGEMIGWELLEEAGWKGKVSRMWLSEFTPKIVRAAYESPRDYRDTYNLYIAARSRSKADFLFGINTSRAASITFGSYGESISVGRIQSPVVYMVYKQYMERKNFSSRIYFTLKGRFVHEGRSWVMRHVPPERVWDRGVVDALAQKIRGVITPLVREDTVRREPPPKPFSLTRLQQQMNRLKDWSPDYTLAVLQVLYDDEYMSYPRTDFDVIHVESKEIAPKVIANLVGLRGVSNNPIAVDDIVYREGGKNAVYVDAEKPHYAITPTVRPMDFSTLTDVRSGEYTVSAADQVSLYQEVAKRFLAIHAPDCEASVCAFSASIDGHVFNARSRVVLVPGWRAVDVDTGQEDDDAIPSVSGQEEPHEDTQALPDVPHDAPIMAESVEVISQNTTPPEKMTERALLRRMRGIAGYPEYISDPALRKVLKETSGLGTSATQGSIIRRVYAVGYVAKVKGEVVPTQKGIDFVETMQAIVPDCLDPARTAYWEMILEEIAGGTKTEAGFLDGICTQIDRDVARIFEERGKRVFASSKSMPVELQKKARKPSVASSSKKSSATRPSTQHTRLKVAYDQREQAKALGARWEQTGKYWYAAQGADLSVFRRAGFL